MKLSAIFLACTLLPGHIPSSPPDGWPKACGKYPQYAPFTVAIGVMDRGVFEWNNDEIDKMTLDDRLNGLRTKRGRRGGIRIYFVSKPGSGKKEGTEKAMLTMILERHGLVFDKPECAIQYY